MNPYPKLFSPVRIGTLELPNRLVMPAMETHLGNAEGFVTDELIDYYRWRARGGVGLIIFENTCAHPSGRVNKGMVRIDDDKYVDGFSRLCRAVHEEKGRIAIQLSHAGRQTLSDFIGQQPVAPSPIACPVLHEEPRELSVPEIKDLVEAFAQGALRAKRAGADAVEFHMAHGYLICQFLSPYSNQRTDAYGGSVENRARFSREILARARELLGKDFPLICRISADECVEGGLEIEQAKAIAVVLEKAGADAIHVSACNYESAHLNMPAYYRPEGCFVPLARAVKAVVRVPVLTVGRIRRPQMMEDILVRGDADLICVGRPLIADPFLPKKIQSGREDEIRSCLSCNRCIESVASGKMVCGVNPDIGKERQSEGPPAAVKKKVLIAGGGPAGMQAAIVAAQRGHAVTLVEKGGRLGGQMSIAGCPPCKEQIADFKQYLVRRVAQLPIAVELNKEITAEEIAARGPDAVVVATGSVHAFPGIQGIDAVKPVTVAEAFLHPEKLGQSVVVVGGGPEGMELADFLTEQRKKVVVLEMKRLIGLGLPPAVRILLERRIEERGIEVHVKTKVVEFTADSIVVEDKKMGRRTIRGFDSVVVAILHKSSNALFAQLEGKVKELYLVGDAKEPRLIREAIGEGDCAARSL